MDINRYPIFLSIEVLALESHCDEKAVTATSFIGQLTESDVLSKVKQIDILK